MRVLVVEDDRLLRDGIHDALTADEYRVDGVPDGDQALLALSTETYNAVVLDWGLPGMSGIEVLKKIRADGNDVPVLILTARDGVNDRITGLDSGADDYLAKPFDVGELKARLRAIERRSVGRATAFLEHGDIQIDPATREVLYQGEPVELKRRQYALLLTLLENAGRVLSREQLEQLVYGWDAEVESNTIEVHVHALRKKFYRDLIRTVRGVGYVSDTPDKK